MEETNESRLGTYVALTLVVSITVLAGIGVYPLIAGEDEDADRGMVWTDNWVCEEEPNRTTVSASEQGMVLTRSAPGGVAVDMDEQNESVTFRIVTRDTNVGMFYIAGDHRYENPPVVCDDKITLSGDELEEKGELALMGVVKGTGGVEEVKWENGTRVVSPSPDGGQYVQSVTYDFTEEE